MIANNQFYTLKRPLQEEEYFFHFYKSPIQMRACMGRELEKIYLVEVEEDPDGPYYGWKDPDGTYSMIYPSEALFRICFPYGPEEEERRGRGISVRLHATEKGSYPGDYQEEGDGRDE